MDDYEGRHQVEQSLADVEHQLACVQDYLGLDARQPRVRDFIKSVNEFSPWVKEELEKIADLKRKKKSLEDDMDQIAAEAFKVRLSRRFSQIDMAQRAKTVRDLGAQVLGLNERINSITAHMHERAGNISDLLEEAAQFSYNAPAVNNITANKLAQQQQASTNRGGSTSSSRDQNSNQSRKKRRTSGVQIEDAVSKREQSSTSSSSTTVAVTAGAATVSNNNSFLGTGSGVGTGGGVGALPIDPAEPLYCLCRQVSYGDMIACDNPLCKYEWFHFPCVKIQEQPVGKWYCPLCKDYMMKQNGFFDQYTSNVDTSVADQVMRDHGSSSNKHHRDHHGHQQQHQQHHGRNR